MLNRRKKRRRQALCFGVAFFCLALLLVLAFRGGLAFLPGNQEAQGPQGPQGQGMTGEQGLPEANEAAAGKGLRPVPPPQDWEFTIIATGDIMMHSPQTKAGWQPESKSYDFSFMFDKVAPLLRTGDLVIGNLETPLAGEANGGYTGYPMFNAPEILAQNLKDAGFTLVSTANNHSLDRGFKGLCTTLDNLDAAGLMHTGAFRTPEEPRILQIETAGVKIGLIAATYGTNGLVLKQENAFALNYIQADQLLADIRQARQEGAQYVIVMLHWGIEYQTKPNQEQTELARLLLQGGADLILGNHPHVLQRGEAIHLAELYAQTAQDAGEPESAGPSASGSEAAGPPLVYRASGKDQVKFVMYSQGNFVSNQEGMDRLCSILLKLTIGVDGATGEPYFKNAEYIPVYTQKRNRQGVSHHQVWPLELALAQLAGSDPPFGGEDKASLPKAWDYILNSQPALSLLTLENTPVWSELTGQGSP
jgi:poly-gamma-glutamate synthesis protein (capsule biosynthesis protein)